jgi:hypothetical protein
MLPSYSHTRVKFIFIIFGNFLELLIECEEALVIPEVLRGADIVTISLFGI